MSAWTSLLQEEELVSLLSNLVQIESVNPSFPGGKAGEGDIIQFIQTYFEKLGISYRLQEVFPGRKNLIATYPGAGKGTLCMEAHVDTVSVEGMTRDPFTPVVENGRLYGRGAVDDKGSVAAMMYAMAMLKKGNFVPPCDIDFVAAVDEEYHYGGVAKLVESGYRPDGAVVGEPTGLAIGRACRGCSRFDIVTHGVAAHTSNPGLGRNAVVDMAKLIYAMETRLFPSYAKTVHPLLGSPVMTVSLIHGGEFVNAVPDTCTISVDRRLLPGEEYATVRQELEGLIAELKEEDPRFCAEIGQPWVTDYPMDVDAGTEVVRAASAAAETLQLPPDVTGVLFGCDASKLARVGVPSIVCGPGHIAQAHTVDEYIEIDQLCRGAMFYAQLCMEFQGKAERKNV